MLSEVEAEKHVAGIAFKIGPPRTVGAELEWTVHDAADPFATVDPVRYVDAVCGLALPGGGVVTIEPGGQVEVSSAPAAGLAECLSRLRADAEVLQQALAAAGLFTGDAACDAFRPALLTAHTPRYSAMRETFDAAGPDGAAMMCSTAALQVNLDAGDRGTGPRSAALRWAALHRLGPVLVAIFANSPLLAGRVSGWASTRQAVWRGIDPSRTRPCSIDGLLDTDPGACYASYALDASLLVLPSEGLDWRPPSPAPTFRQWLRAGPGGGCIGRAATARDLDYHLTTLFPPVRARGWYEVRYLDQQAGDDWEVAVAVMTVLLDDTEALAEALDAAEPVAGRWTQAARWSVADPDLGRAALSCLDAAARALVRVDVTARTRRLVDDFRNRFTALGRCPADDRLDDWQHASAGRHREEVSS